MHDRATEALLRSLTAIVGGDHQQATEHCAEAVRSAGDARLPATLLAYLDGAAIDAAGAVVYHEPTAFDAFIGGGDNPALYRSTIDALLAFDQDPASILDIGCGDGRVTAATIGPSTKRVDLIEPSAAMLQTAEAAVSSAAEAGASERRIGTTNADLARFVAEADRGNRGDRRWARAQSTFAMHAIAPHQRPPLLAWLARRVDRMAIVEFDTPGFVDRSPDHLQHLVASYERGLGEYDHDSPAALGFLMPVLVGQLDPTATRHTWEQPIDRWCDDLESSGFVDVEHRAIHDYWWSTAHLVTARGSGRQVP